MTARPLTGPRLRAGYRRLVVLAAATLAVWAGVSLALTHHPLATTNPANQETLQNAPHAVALTLAYPVGPRVTSADGHSVVDSFGFAATTAPAREPPTTPQTSPPATPVPTRPALLPGWLKLVIGAVAIIFGVTVARRASRRGNASRP